MKTQRQSITFLTNIPKQVVAYKIKGNYEKSDWQEVIVILNSSNEEVKIQLDTGDWQVLVDEKNASSKGMKSIKEYVVVSPISAYVI